MITVSDTTPISELAKTGRLRLLHDVYKRIEIPCEVYDELTAGSHPAVVDVPLARWIKVRSVSDPHEINRMRAATGLGLGECAAIALAQELKASRILPDDWEARKEALTRGLRATGTVGTLLTAKRRGLIPNVRKELDDLLAHGTYIGRPLYDRALRLAGEWPTEGSA